MYLRNTKAKKDLENTAKNEFVCYFKSNSTQMIGK